MGLFLFGFFGQIVSFWESERTRNLEQSLNLSLKSALICNGKVHKCSQFLNIRHTILRTLEPTCALPLEYRRGENSLH